MRFFTDPVDVTFAGLDHVFHVSSVFCEIDLGSNVFTIKWYGVIIAFGFVLAALLGGRVAYTWRMSLDKMVDVLIYGTLAGIVGARLYYVIFKWDYFSQHPLEIPMIWHGGLAIYGGLIGGLIAAFVVCRVKKLNIPNLLDLCGMSFLVGQGIGRWGNFANQEAFGMNTDSPFGMWSTRIAEYVSSHQDVFAQQGFSVDASKPVHPTFLYESVCCLLGALLLYIVCRKARRFHGEMFLIYCVWYGAERAIVEGLRTDSLYIPGTTLRISQLVSAVIAVVALVVLIVLLVRYKKSPWQVEGRDFFYDSEGTRQTDFTLKYNAKKNALKTVTGDGSGDSPADGGSYE